MNIFFSNIYFLFLAGEHLTKSRDDGVCGQNRRYDRSKFPPARYRSCSSRSLQVWWMQIWGSLSLSLMCVHHVLFTFRMLWTSFSFSFYLFTLTVSILNLKESLLFWLFSPCDAVSSSHLFLSPSLSTFFRLFCALFPFFPSTFSILSVLLRPSTSTECPPSWRPSRCWSSPRGSWWKATRVPTFYHRRRASSVC